MGSLPFVLLVPEPSGLRRRRSAIVMAVVYFDSHRAHATLWFGSGRGEGLVYLVAGEKMGLGW